jgi:hypothetical protein
MEYYISPGVLIPIYVCMTRKLICDNIMFRCLHTTTLSLFSLYHILTYGLELSNAENNVYFKEIPSFAYISMYALTYLAVDLKSALSRIDLLLHHIIVFIWIVFNYSTGITALTLINESLSSCYLIKNLKYQHLLRVFVISFIRYPIWINMILSNYWMNNSYSIIHNYLNSGISITMLVLDLYWMYKNFKLYLYHTRRERKYKQLLKNQIYMNVYKEKLI